jgi:hypothetical protein
VKRRKTPRSFVSNPSQSGIAYSGSIAAADNGSTPAIGPGTSTGAITQHADLPNLPSFRAVFRRGKKS